MGLLPVPLLDLWLVLCILGERGGLSPITKGIPGTFVHRPHLASVPSPPPLTNWNLIPSREKQGTAHGEKQGQHVLVTIRTASYELTICMPGHVFSPRSSISIRDLEGPNEGSPEVYRLLCFKQGRTPKTQRKGGRVWPSSSTRIHTYQSDPEPLSFRDRIPETNVLMQKTMIIYK